MELHFGGDILLFRLGDKRRGLRFEIDGEKAPVFDEFVGRKRAFRNG